MEEETGWESIFTTKFRSGTYILLNAEFANFCKGVGCMPLLEYAMQKLQLSTPLITISAHLNFNKHIYEPGHKIWYVYLDWAFYQIRNPTKQYLTHEFDINDSRVSVKNYCFTLKSLHVWHIFILNWLITKL